MKFWTKYELKMILIMMRVLISSLKLNMVLVVDDIQSQGAKTVRHTGDIFKGYSLPLIFSCLFM